MASTTRYRPILATYGRLAVTMDAKQVNHSYLLDNKLSNGMG